MKGGLIGTHHFLRDLFVEVKDLGGVCGFDWRGVETEGFGYDGDDNLHGFGIFAVRYSVLLRILQEFDDGDSKAPCCGI
jgi:hypothetical protein